MPYKNKSDRDAKHEWELEKKRAGAHEARMERQRARRALDKKGVDRTGKDVAHKVAFDKGGSNKQGVRVESASKNRSFKRDSKHNLVSETSKRERKKK